MPWEGQHGTYEDPPLAPERGPSEPGFSAIHGARIANAFYESVCYGATSVDLGAPGELIYSPVPGGGYAYQFGTSIAAPYVAGTAALVLSSRQAAGVPSDATSLKEKLLSSIDPNPAMTGKTVSGGRLNAASAVGYVEPPPPPPPVDACPEMAGVQASASECAEVTTDPPPPPVEVVVADTSLTLSPSGQALDYQQRLTLRGTLRAEGSSYPEGSRTVYLERRPSGGSFARFATVQTDASGDYSYSYVPSRNYSYRAVSAGKTGEAKPSTSETASVGVRVAVKHTTSTTTLKLGKAKTISGSVAPAHAGKKVEVTISKKGAGVVKTLTPRLSSTSKFATSFKPKQKGTYLVRVSFGGDADHLGDAGPAKEFKVFGGSR